MDVRSAKDLLHIRQWLNLMQAIVDDGREHYLNDPIAQEAGDALMMKVGEAANRLSRAELTPPAQVRWADAIANRNWVIHQYDEIDRDITWATLSRSAPEWAAGLSDLFGEAEECLNGNV